MLEQQNSAQYAVCIDNNGYEASLEVGKIYRMVNDDQAASHGYVRVVDESGEDYAYGASRFYSLAIPGPLADLLDKAA